jgi:Subtilase family
MDDLAVDRDPPAVRVSRYCRGGHGHFLSLLPPGRWGNSSIPGSAFANFSGTSMATPHVAGAWALLKQAKPSAAVPEILGALRRGSDACGRGRSLRYVHRPSLPDRRHPDRGWAASCLRLAGLSRDRQLSEPGGTDELPSALRTWACLSADRDRRHRLSPADSITSGAPGRPSGLIWLVNGQLTGAAAAARRGAPFARGGSAGGLRVSLRYRVSWRPPLRMMDLTHARTRADGCPKARESRARARRRVITSCPGQSPRVCSLSVRRR